MELKAVKDIMEFDFEKIEDSIETLLGKDDSEQQCAFTLLSKYPNVDQRKKALDVIKDKLTEEILKKSI